MEKIVLDSSGEMRRDAFYRFQVPFEDTPFGGPAIGSILAPRTPTADELVPKSIDDPNQAYMWVEFVGGANRCVETRDCPLNKEHVTRYHYRDQRAEACGGKRLSAFIPSSGDFTFVISENLRQRIEALRVRGARVDPLIVTRDDNGQRIDGFWTLQFFGNARRRLPKFQTGTNRCPYCGKSKIICDACGYWTAYCTSCEKLMVIVEDHHDGKSDKRIPFHDGCGWRVLEGSKWDGSDLVGGTGFSYASKRFIDWLLRIHAAPFYAEPVWLCIDGMSDQQKKWFDDLQKPFEV
jgi:hypothetical protein